MVLGFLLRLIPGYNTLVRLAHFAVGVGYPALESFKAIESRGTADDTQWLSYWVCYALFSFLETALWPLLRWVPLYGAARVAALLWLAAPQFKGATLVYRVYARPLILAAAERAREVPALAPYVEGLAPARPAAAAAAAAGDKFSEVAGAAEERFAQLKAHAQ